MPYKFGKRSLANLETCHPDLQSLAWDVIEIIDHSIIQGKRGKEEQNQLFHAGKSKLQWPHSKHNTTPSRAMDVVPYPIDWHDIKRFALLMGAYKMAAHVRKIEIRLGGDWNGDNLFNESFFDAPHIELVGR